MDIREYIESGILELYAMGALPQEEAQEVTEAVARHPELRAELAAISHALQAIAPVEGKGPSLELREKLLASLPDSSSATLPQKQTSSGGKIVPIEGAFSPTSSTSRTGRYLLAASFIGFLLSASAAIWFWSEWKSTEEHLADAVDLIERTTTSYQQTEQELRTLRDYHSHQVRMTSAGDKSPGALAIVYWNPETKEVYLDPALMPALPQGHQYQLWAIADGDPVDAGVFDPADSTKGQMPGLQRMKNVHEVKVFAVTVEPHGGSETPTLSTMTVSGQI